MQGLPLLTVLIAPFIVLLMIGYALPIGRAIVDTVFAKQGLLAPYIELLNDQTFRAVLLRTVATAATVSLACLLMAYPTAEFINRARPRLQPVLLALVVVPLWSSVIARTYGWVGIFQRDGLLDRVAGVFGLGPQSALYTWFAVVVGMVHVLLPVLLLPVFIAVRRYDRRLSFASESLGAGGVRTLISVKLPVLAPQLFAASVVVFVLALGFFITPSLLGGPGSLLASTYISQQLFQVFNLQRAQAMSMLLLVVTFTTLGLVGLVTRLVRKAL